MDYEIGRLGKGELGKEKHREKRSLGIICERKKGRSALTKKGGKTAPAPESTCGKKGMISQGSSESKKTPGLNEAKKMQWRR